MVGTEDGLLSPEYRDRRDRSRRLRSRRNILIASATVLVLAGLAVIAFLVVVPAVRGPVFTEDNVYSALVTTADSGVQVQGQPPSYSGYLSEEDVRGEASMFISGDGADDPCLRYRYSEWLLDAPVDAERSDGVFTVYQLNSSDIRSLGTSARLFPDRFAAERYLDRMRASLTLCIASDANEGMGLAPLDIDGTDANIVASVEPASTSSEGGTIVQALVQRGNAVVLSWQWYVSEPADPAAPPLVAVRTLEAAQTD